MNAILRYTVLFFFFCFFKGQKSFFGCQMKIFGTQNCVSEDCIHTIFTAKMSFLCSLSGEILFTICVRIPCNFIYYINLLKAVQSFMSRTVLALHLDDGRKMKFRAKGQTNQQKEEVGEAFFHSFPKNMPLGPSLYVMRNRVCHNYSAWYRVSQFSMVS